jgi:cyclopropane-fatty-acyl-phospholipid synthase
MEFFVEYVQPFLPDFVVRVIVRQAMRMYRNQLESADFPQKELRLVERMKSLTDVTFETSAANDQHYQVPTDFFLSHLGEKLKYSSCEWDQATDLAVAESNTIRSYQRHLRLDELPDGAVVLEVGNGWGSLALSNAVAYPNLVFESFSNSETQIRHIREQIAKRGIENLTVWKQDIDDFVKNGRPANVAANVAAAGPARYSRIVSIECIEHCRAYHLLFRKLSSVLRDDGFCFFQILGHSRYSYLMNNSSWMGRNFFTGGTIPSMHLFHYFNEDLVVKSSTIIRGTEYQKTLDAWLWRMYDNRTKILETLKAAYGNAANKHYQGWRMFYLMSSESFGFNSGKDWCVGYFVMEKRMKKNDN